MNEEELHLATQKAADRLAKRGMAVRVTNGTLQCILPGGVQVVVRNTVQGKAPFDREALLDKFSAAILLAAVRVPLPDPGVLQGARAAIMTEASG